jgi:hypothetical protein
MRTSRRSGWRRGIGALAVLAIASGIVVGMATAAGAEPVTDVEGLEKSCAKGTGTYNGGKISTGETVGICTVKGGYVICVDKQDGSSHCQGNRDRKGSLEPTDVVRGTNGVKLTTEGEPASHLWKQKLSIPVLTDVVCPSLGGGAVASADATIGACVAPTAMIVCAELPGTNCVGTAETKKQAASISKQVKKTVRNAGSTSTTATTPTSSKPPTTKVCPIGGCPPPTVPPSKVPSSSVPVSPPKGGGRGHETSS